MCDQVLKSVLVPLNKVGSRTVFGPCRQVAKTVRSILHLALVLAIPWWGPKHFHYHWFSLLVLNSWSKQSEGYTAICQRGAFTATEVVSCTVGYLDVSEDSAWWCSVRCLHVAKGAFSVIFQRCSTNHTQGLSGKVFISKWRKTPENANCWAEWAAGGPIPRAALWFFQWSSLGRGMQHPQPQCTWCCQDTYEWVSLVRTAGAQWEQRKGILAEW